MNKKAGRNDVCPCGSGRKAKKCCGATRPSTHYTTLDRMELFEALESFIVAYFREALVDAYEDFWGAFVGREAELSHEVLHLSNDAQFMWFVCDCELESRKTVLDLLLEHDSTLSAGAQAFARVIRRAKMCAYEAVEVVPGVSITLRDVLSGTTVTVCERTASRTLNRHDWIAARLVERGPSGKAEMERGVLAIPHLYKEWLYGELTELREEAIEDPDLVSMAEALPRLVHELWVGCILEPAIPQLHNTDGEPTLITRAHFDVKDRARLERALDSCSALTREGSQWVWFGKNATDTQVLLGTFEFKGRALLLETNSKERGERGVALLRKLCGAAAVHRATTHEDLEPMLRADLKAQARTERMIEDEAQPTEGGLPPAIAEALVLDHYAKHYRAWIDEPVPALDGETPRDAARTSTQQERVRELIKGLEITYQQCLREGTPAYDPSWMWSELGLRERAQQLPPPLPHERLEHFIEGTRELVVDVAESIRARPGFDDASTVVEPGSVQRLLDVQRFLKDHPKSAHVDAPAWQRRELAPHVHLALNFVLHRRKVFWVEEALTYMLAQTEIDVPARDLRMPFASFALVFTDRHVLSLGERLLSKSGGALAGNLLRVVTIFVTERYMDAGRTLDLTFAFDALGDDLPDLVHHTLDLSDDAPVQRAFPQEDDSMLVEPHAVVTTPLRELLGVAVNAILYATSSGAEMETRAAKATPRRSAKQSQAFTSESVYYLPGAIDITQVRRLKELARVGEGRDVLRRYLVRGHWRRAAKNWKDQRLRWIAPHWKGPDLAMVIERAYRLKP